MKPTRCSPVLFKSGMNLLLRFPRNVLELSPTAVGPLVDLRVLLRDRYLRRGTERLRDRDLLLDRYELNEIKVISSIPKNQ